MRKTHPLALFLAVASLAVAPRLPAANAPPPGAGWTTVDTRNAAQARHENAAFLLDGMLYLVGGRGDRPLQALDPATGTWSTRAAPPLEVHHAQAVTHEGKAYLVSGFTGGFPDEQPLTHVLVYDPATDRWSQGAAIPEDRRRGAAGVVNVDGTVYLVGGNTRGHNSGYVAWADTLDLASGTWTRLPDAPRPRDHFHAAVVGGKVYAAGGRLSSHDTGQSFALTVAEVDVYDPASQRWSTLAQPLPTPRAGSASVAAQGRLVVLGGESGTQQAAHAEVEAFDPATGRWQALAPMPTGRHGTQAVVAGGAIQIAAGSANRGGGPELADVITLQP